MKLVIQRERPTNLATIGSLTVDGVHECYTLEDPDGAGDRINAGTYSVITDFSNRFQKIMPHIIGSAAIDDRGIRIHAGNTEADTEGCVLVGRSHSPTSVEESRDAFNALFEKLSAALARGEHIALEVLDADEIPSAQIPVSVHTQSGPGLQVVLPPTATRLDILQSLMSVVQRAWVAFHS